MPRNMTAFMISLLAIALLAWLYLLLFNRSFWYADQRLEADGSEPDIWPEVVAVIPARDEADSIAAALSSHAASTYRGRFSIVLMDDHSTDGTAALAADVASQSARPITIAPAPPLEPGWTGKLSALHHGMRLADSQAPHARYILFTDADIVHAPQTLSRLVAKAEREQLGLVSIMARLDDRGLWGALLIPAFVFFFQKLYPFRAVNDPRSPVAAAAGGCILVLRDRLRKVDGLSAIRDKLIDDCAIAHRIKNTLPRTPIWIGLSSGEVISLRDNRSLSSVWSMVTRTAFTQLEYCWWRLLGTIVGMVVLYLSGPVAVITSPLHQTSLLTLLGAGAWAAVAIAYLPTCRLYNRHLLLAFTLPVTAALYSVMTVVSALKHWRGTGGQWKGRSYSSHSGTDPTTGRHDTGQVFQRIQPRRRVIGRWMR
jgi:hopene-associated glycosyltransferase HpnB